MTEKEKIEQILKKMGAEKLPDDTDRIADETLRSFKKQIKQFWTLMMH